MANMAVGGANPYVNSYNRINRSSQITSQKISTGSNHPNAALGASEYSIAARLTKNIGAAAQSTRNTQNMSAMIKVAQGATGNTISGLTKIQSHLVNAANDTNGSLDRQAIQKEINQLVAQIDSNARVEYNGQRLLDGSRSSLTGAGLDGYISLPVGDIRAQTLGLTDAEGNVTIDAVTPEGIQVSLEKVGGALKYLQDMENKLNSSVFGGYSLDEALDEATTQGAQLQRLEFQEANYVTMEEHMIGALSNLNDADIAAQVVNLRTEQTLEQLALFGTRMFNQNIAGALSLLQ